MLVRVEMELEDVPGQLVKALDPISRFGGNIQNVVHERDKKTPLGRVPVTVVFDVDERARFDKIMSALREMGVRVTRVGEMGAGLKSTILMIGHIIHTDIRDTIDRLNSLEGVRVLDLSLAMGAVGEESTARMVIVTENEDRARAALSLLTEIASQKKLLLIKSLEETR
jgi:ACT domain-containing protein